jgi:8-oxo-dGTP pyrophosphatase MutT (NUDIX family)
MSVWNRLDRALVQRALRAPAEPEAAPAKRRAAIAALLSDGDAGVELLLIRRAVRLSDPWSGHMALPGGHLDPSDANLQATAERETREELGIELSQAQFLGRLQEVRPHRSGDLSVTPFVFALEKQPPLVPNAEVDLALWVPIAELAAGTTRFEHELSLEGRSWRFPAFRVGEHVVWGLTYRVVTTLIELVTLESALLSR